MRRALRTQAMVLSFYVIDSLLLAAYVAHGTIAPLVPVFYGAAGCGLTGLFAAMMRVGLHRQIGGARFTSAQLLSACGLMLATAAAVPQNTSFSPGFSLSGRT